MKITKNHRLVIISFDAVGSLDLPYLESLPNFKMVFEQSSGCRNVQSVYPSVTYPAHTSIMTGKMPVHHGVINNTRLQPKRETPDWMWQRKFIKGTTLYDEAIKKGYKTAALLWPVTAKSRIHYNLPEVLANRPWQNQILVSMTNGSLFYQWELQRKFGHLRDGVRQPALDNFVHASALHTIDKYNPDLLLIHYTDVDTNRHIYGVNHPKAKEALIRHDKRLGEILAALQKKGKMDETTFVILGDHYQKDVDRVVYFNFLLKEHGFLHVKNNKIKDYEFIAKNCDGCCYIYVNHKRKPSLERTEQLRRLLEACKNENTYGIERIYTAKEAAELGADGNCICLIEAKDGVYYLDEFEYPTCRAEELKKGKLRGAHGYLPSKPNYQTFFAMSGYGIKKGNFIKEMALWDEGPTLAKLLEVTLPQADGHAVSAFLE